MATHSSILAWRIWWREEPGRLQSMESQKVGQDWATSLHFMQMSNSWIQNLQLTGEVWESKIVWKSSTDVVVQSLSQVQLCHLTDCSLPGSLSTISWVCSIESVMLSSHLLLCCLHLLLPSIFPSIRVFPNESSLHIKWPKYWSLSTNPSNEYSGLISSRIDWFDLLAVQGTLKSPLQHHRLKASIHQHIDSSWSLGRRCQERVESWQGEDHCPNDDV